MQQVRANMKLAVVHWETHVEQHGAPFFLPKSPFFRCKLTSNCSFLQLFIPSQQPGYIPDTRAPSRVIGQPLHPVIASKHHILHGAVGGCLRYLSPLCAPY